MPVQRAPQIDDEDPFEVYLRPSPTETAIEREIRIAAEQEALRISQQIDEVLKAERVAMKKRRSREVKCLLLGQEGSGKTTTLKQFLLNFSKSVFSGERAGWRAVVFLNVITSIRIILENLTAECENPERSSSSVESMDLPTFQLGEQPSSFAELKLRLTPVLHLEGNLVHKLTTAGAEESRRTIRSWPTSSKHEVAVRSGTAWKRAFERHRHDNADSESRSSSEGIDWNNREDPGIILHACRNEMAALWNNDQVRSILKKRKVNLEDSGFFLEELDVITGQRYIPTDEDILRARLKTVGASEHTFSIKSGPEKGMDWKLYDVGGSRTQRPTWAPFFDDVDAILFLAPISAFDQVLSEDRRVNRLEDSLILWTELCRNKILEKVPLILFLNKCDLLQRKLDAGVSVRKYVTSYGERRNDFSHVSTYFRNKFEAVRKHHSPPDREIFIHLTSMTDMKGSEAVIASVRDMITRIHLKMTMM